MALSFRLSLIGKVSAAKDPEPPGFRIRSHDFHGPLPEIVVHDTGDSLAILDDISREAAKVNAIARHREELARYVSGLPVPAAHGPRRRRGCRDASGRKDVPGGPDVLAGVR